MYLCPLEKNFLPPPPRLIFGTALKTCMIDCTLSSQKFSRTQIVLILAYNWMGCHKSLFCAMELLSALSIDHENP